MFAVSSTKGGIPSKPEVLDRMPPLVLYGLIIDTCFHGTRFLKCFSWY